MVGTHLGEEGGHAVEAVEADHVKQKVVFGVPGPEVHLLNPVTERVGLRERRTYVTPKGKKKEEKRKRTKQTKGGGVRVGAERKRERERGERDRGWRTPQDANRVW